MQNWITSTTPFTILCQGAKGTHHKHMPVYVGRCMDVCIVGATPWSSLVNNKQYKLETFLLEQWMASIVVPGIPINFFGNEYMHVHTKLWVLKECMGASYFDWCVLLHEDYMHLSNMQWRLQQACSLIKKWGVLSSKIWSSNLKFAAIPCFSMLTVAETEI